MNVTDAWQPGPDLEALLEDLRSHRGVDLTGYKRATLWRRINRRMQQIGVAGFAQYVDYLHEQPGEVRDLLDSVLINVTSFYRDPAAWGILAQEILPVIVAGKPTDAPIRVWSAGCASGEEPLTLAMLWAECLGPEQFRRRVKIYATDVDEDALTRARQACYAAEDVNLVPDAMRSRYFERTGSRYTFRADLRRAVIFGRHDLTQDAPISHVDLLACRNTLIYLNADTQRRIFERFRLALAEDGFLFLGKAEMLMSHANLFYPVDFRYRFFSKTLRAELRDRLLALSHSAADMGRAANRSARLAEKASSVIRTAQLVADASGVLLQANQRARRMFGLTRRDIGRRLRELALGDSPLGLAELIDGIDVGERRGGRIIRTLPDGPVQHLSVEVAALRDDDGTLLGVSVVFDDQTAAESIRGQLQRTSGELERAYARLKAANHELEASSGQLHATAERLDTKLEQVRLMNQWRETMNERIEAGTRELHAGNAGLQALTEELSQTHRLLDNLVSCDGAATVVLDRDLKVRFWNGRSEDLWGLTSGEVAGRYFPDLVTGLPVASLRAAIDAGLGESSSGEMVVPASDRHGRAIECRVNLRPVIVDGAVRAVILMIQSACPIA